jgi:predicted nucleic acid-binding protein
MASKVFLDANILLDFTLQRTGHNEAKKILQKGIDGDILLCTTPAVIHIVQVFRGRRQDEAGQAADEHEQEPEGQPAAVRPHELARFAPRGGGRDFPFRWFRSAAHAPSPAEHL